MRREDLCKEEAYDWDDSKLIIYAGAMGGEALHQELLGHYHLQMEMVSADYVHDKPYGYGRGHAAACDDAP